MNKQKWIAFTKKIDASATGRQVILLAGDPADSSDLL